MGPSDADLVLLLRRRQAGAFDEVYRRYRERVWRFLYRLAGARAPAEDLFQDTWLAAARNAHRLREDTQLIPWLLTIARNKHRNGLRFAALERRRLQQAAAEPAGPGAGPEQDTQSRRDADRVTIAFQRLPEAHREILLCCVAEGLDSEATGRMLGLRPEAVRKRLSRARAALARLAGLTEAAPSETAGAWEPVTR